MTHEEEPHDVHHGEEEVAQETPAAAREEETETEAFETPEVEESSTSETEETSTALMSRADRWKKGARRVLTSTWRATKWTTALALVSVVTLVAVAAYMELETSHFQRAYFEEFSEDVSYSLVEVGPDSEVDVDQIPQAPNGPWDLRHGYAHTRQLAKAIPHAGYELVAHSTTSEGYQELLDEGFNPPVEEKMQMGMTLYDAHGNLLRARQSPERIWSTFDEVPIEIAETLTFVKNRELLHPSHPTQNPVIEWDRIARAGAMYGLSKIGVDVDVPGGSTLATQLEKFRHSSDGTTDGIYDKYQQMMSASIRVYAEGADTRDDRERITLHYLNGVPFSSQAPVGPVFGMRDGLWAYFGIESDEMERAFSKDGDINERGRIYAAALGLIISQRAPTTLLHESPERLNELVRTNLAQLEKEKIIDGELAAAARNSLPLTVLDEAPARPEVSIVRRKAIDALEAHLATATGMDNLYDLEHYDLTAKTTLDLRAQKIAEEYLLDSLYDPAFLEENGFYKGDSLLSKDQDASKIQYSLTVYETTEKGNLLRVQVDTLDKQFNFNEQAKLDLGSTAKLRTLITYLNLVEKLYHEHKDKSRSELWRVDTERGDNLEVWVRRQLIYNEGITLEEILEHALEKRYSASPYRRYFTGGGMHKFHNFNKRSNGRRYRVEDGLAHSVNLISINVMKDIVDHYRWNEVDSSIIEDREHPKRKEYLDRWVDTDSSVFLNSFWSKYEKLSKDDILSKVYGEEGTDNLAALTITYRSITGETEPTQAFRDYVKATMPEDERDELPENDEEWAELFDEHDATQFNWNERGYVASVHPLELWIAHERYQNPKLSHDELMAKSDKAIDEAYNWLYKNMDSTRVHDKIYMGLEEDAFKKIHAEWQQLGYPFEELVPSLATSLGSSGDRPEALATLMGIIMNEGLKIEKRRFESLVFGEGTPYELRFRALEPKKTRVLSPEVARTARRAIERVVEQGTARRAGRAFMVPDEDGDMVRDRTVRLGGKTGTGDHRQKSFDRWGHVIDEKFVSRSATFVFIKDTQYFGVITIHVEGEESGDYNFTSSMATEIFRQLFPKLTNELDKIYPHEQEFIEPSRSNKAPEVSMRTASLLAKPL